MGPFGRRHICNSTAQLWGPTGMDFDLYLYQYRSGQWVVLSKSISLGPNERVSVVAAGYFYWVVYAARGSGAFKLCVASPKGI